MCLGLRNEIFDKPTWPNSHRRQLGNQVQKWRGSPRTSEIRFCVECNGIFTFIDKTYIESSNSQIAVSKNTVLIDHKDRENDYDRGATHSITFTFSGTTADSRSRYSPITQTANLEA